jgi:hypothetical protein
MAIHDKPKVQENVPITLTGIPTIFPRPYINKPHQLLVVYSFFKCKEC